MPAQGPAGPPALREVPLGSIPPSRCPLARKDFLPPTESRPIQMCPGGTLSPQKLPTSPQEEVGWVGTAPSTCGHSGPPESTDGCGHTRDPFMHSTLLHSSLALKLGVSASKAGWTGSLGIADPNHLKNFFLQAITLEWIDKKVLMSSTGSSTECPGIMEGIFKKNVHMRIT